MTKIISICNQKGGTGKTTTAVNLSSIVAIMGRRVLLVDIDPQGNATSGIGINKNTIEKSVYDVLLMKMNIKEALQKSQIADLDIVPCNINLTGAEIELVGALSRETRLKRTLDEIKQGYDFIFIDLPPSLGLLTLNAFVASDSILIPIQCEFYALEGVSQLINTINLVKESLNSNLTIEGVLLTMADFRTNLTNEVISEIKGYFKDKVYNTIIPRNIKLGEAPSFGKPIILYDKNSIGSKKYEEFAVEFLARYPEFANKLENRSLAQDIQIKLENSKEEKWKVVP